VLLLDAPQPGSGRVFDWALAAEVPGGQPFMIAGGLNPANVAGAIVRTRPWGVDVASGVERRPGEKDPVKLRAFVAAARRAAADLADGDDTVPAPDARADQPQRPTPYDWEDQQ